MYIEGLAFKVHFIEEGFMGDGKCSLDTIYYDVSKIMAEFPGLNSVGSGTAKRISNGGKPFDGTVSFGRCEKFQREDGTMSERCNIYPVKADSFGNAAEFIAKYFPGEQNEISKTEITGKYPDDCETPGRRLVHYSMAVVLNSMPGLLLSYPFTAEQKAAVEKYIVAVQGGSEELRHSRVDIAKMNKKELDVLLLMVILVRDNPPDYYSEKNVKALSIAADEIARMWANMK